jgi:hypothetical protein
MGGIDRAIGVLVAAASISHLALLTVFVWRIFAGDGAGRVFAIFWSLLALAGLVMGIVGRALLKYGGKTPARRWGVYCVGGSTALAGLLLIAAY